MVNDRPEFVLAWANETAIGNDIVICQKDIRAIQLAKGAMYSGAKIMMNRFGTDHVDRVILAGAFGSYIDKISAAVIGLYPDCDLDKVNAVGNAAGDGARMALLNIDKRKEADVIGRFFTWHQGSFRPEHRLIMPLLLPVIFPLTGFTIFNCTPSRFLLSFLSER